MPKAGLRRRLIEGLGSQGLSSISNFALVILVARTSTREAFGAFAIGYSVLWLAHGAIRGFVGETLVVTIAGRTGSKRDTAPALGAAVLLGLAAAVVVGGVGSVWPHPLLGRWLLIFAVALPVLVLQDACRFAAFALHRPSIAATSDGAWLAFQVVAWGSLAAVGVVDAETLTIAWIVACGGAAAAVMRDVGSPSLRTGANWIARHAQLGASFTTEAFLSLGTTHATTYAVGIAAGLPAAGALRAAESLYGPLRSLAWGLRSIALPEATRRAVVGGQSAMRTYAARVSVALSASAVAATAAMMVLPDQVGRMLLGETWTMAATVVLPVGLALLGLLSSVGSRLALRALHATRLALQLRTVSGLLSISLGVGGAMLGLRPAAYGLAVAQLIGSALGWVMVARMSAVEDPSPGEAQLEEETRTAGP